MSGVRLIDQANRQIGVSGNPLVAAQGVRQIQRFATAAFTVVTDPRAYGDIVVPAGQRWRILSAAFRFVAGAGATTRLSGVAIVDGAGAPINGAFASQAASETRIWLLAVGQAHFNSTIGTGMSLPTALIANAGETVRVGNIRVDTTQTGDTIDRIYLDVERID